MMLPSEPPKPVGSLKTPPNPIFPPTNHRRKKRKMKMKEILEEIPNTEYFAVDVQGRGQGDIRPYHYRLRTRPGCHLSLNSGVQLERDMVPFADDVYSYEQDLKSSGMTAETLTMDQWRSQLLRFCPSVLRIIKLFPVPISYHLGRSLVIARKNFQEDVAKQQISEFADYVLSQGGFIVPSVFCVTQLVVLNRCFPLLTPLVCYHAFLWTENLPTLELLLELIVECVDSSESPEVMMNTVKQKIEDGFLLRALDYESKLLADDKDLWEHMLAEHTDVLLDEDQETENWETDGSTLGD